MTMQSFRELRRQLATRRRVMPWAFIGCSANSAGQLLTAVKIVETDIGKSNLSVLSEVIPYSMGKNSWLLRSKKHKVAYGEALSEAPAFVAWPILGLS